MTPACAPSPFLKWAGGKGKAAAAILAAAPAAMRCYHEPFLGGGAVFFALRAARYAGPARLADANGELVECYTVVRDQPEDLVTELRALAGRYLAVDEAARRALYYEVRAQTPVSSVARAARLIFLNRTCYNGLYRVNAAGRFNVPHGRYANPRILDEAGLRAASAALQRTELACEDFGQACARARAGDFVYLDPPYQPLSRTASFTSYTSGSFGPPEQERLRDAFESLARRGVAALLSNSDHPEVRRLYAGRGYTVATTPMSRAINSVGSGRSAVDELLISNLPRHAGGA
ncbi:MAG: DNA adenine methylase [Tepidiformaceae bacterium]